MAVFKFGRSGTLLGDILASAGAGLTLDVAAPIVLGGTIAADSGNVNIMSGTEVAMNSTSEIMTTGGNIELDSDGPIYMHAASGINSATGDIVLVSGAQLEQGILTTGDTARVSLSAITDIDCLGPVTSADGPISMQAGQDIQVSEHVDLVSDGGMIDFDAGRNIAIDDFTLVASDSGTVSLMAVRSISVRDSITTVTGDIHIFANQQVEPTSGSFPGVYLNTHSTICTQAGNIDIRGRGGDFFDNFNFTAGVVVIGEILHAGIGPDAGVISITGRGGPTILQGNGILTQVNSRIASTDSDILLSATSGPTGGSPRHMYHLGILEINGTGTCTITTE